MAEPVRSLTELLEVASSRRFLAAVQPGDRGLAESLPFPFLALVGETEMKLALLMAVINPAVGGVLLLGPRGTGKTTAVRSLAPLLPQVPRSLCPYGCLPEDIETGGIEAVCPDCARKYGQGEPLTFLDPMRLVELPLNAQLADVIGGVDERAAAHERRRLRMGILAQADRNFLYVDEINLLAREITDAILDAAAQGQYMVRRGPVSAAYRSRFVLVGSMNPEEGALRPQIFDRFGLRIFVRGLLSPGEQWEAYRRVQAYLANPRGVIEYYRRETEEIQEEIRISREQLGKVRLSAETGAQGLALVERLAVRSHRAVLSLLEGARAHAAAAGREEVVEEDLRALAPLVLRMRHSAFMEEYGARVEEEDERLGKVMAEVFPPRPSA
ncbi:MAG: magnesium chelatase [Anaerolineales bacterium]|jgi:magnesium chelatase subunit I